MDGLLTLRSSPQGSSIFHDYLSNHVPPLGPTQPSATVYRFVAARGRGTTGQLARDGRLKRPSRRPSIDRHSNGSTIGGLSESSPDTYVTVSTEPCWAVPDDPSIAPHRGLQACSS